MEAAAHVIYLELARTNLFVRPSCNEEEKLMNLDELGRSRVGMLASLQEFFEKIGDGLHYNKNFAISKALVEKKSCYIYNGRICWI